MFAGSAAVPSQMELVHDTSRKGFARGPSGKPLVGTTPQTNANANAKAALCKPLGHSSYNYFSHILLSWCPAQVYPASTCSCCGRWSQAKRRFALRIGVRGCPSRPQHLHNRTASNSKSSKNKKNTHAIPNQPNTQPFASTATLLTNPRDVQVCAFSFGRLFSSRLTIA